jgi:glucose/mannose-6-phosphate isomerase
VSPAPLDDPRTYKRLDPSGLYDRIASLPQQMRDAWDAASALALPEGYAGVKGVAVLGMGGSGIGGHLLRALAVDLGSTTPVDVIRGYTLPAFVSADTLAVASSNSGNTEEVVALAEQAVARGARCIAITTGGLLLDLARRHGIPSLEYAWDAEPRAALGWSFASLLAICGRLRLIPDVAPELAGVLDAMRTVVSSCGRDLPDRDNTAKALAGRLHGRLPVIVGAEAMAPVAYRWRTQTNENAKQWAIAEELPEMNHNAPVGFGGPAGLIPLLHVVLLRHASAHARIRKRVELTAEQLVGAGVAIDVVDIPGDSVLAQMLHAIQLGDLVTYYLGILNGADPSEVDALNWLKRRLAGEADR